MRVIYNEGSHLVGVGADAYIGPNPPEAGPFAESALAAQSCFFDMRFI